MQEAKELAVSAALQLTDRLTTEEVQSSEYPFMAHEFILRSKGDLLMKEKVEKKMVEAFDEDWQSTVLSLKENYTKKKIRPGPRGFDGRCSIQVCCKMFNHRKSC